MLVRGTNTPLVFSPRFQLRTETGQRFRRLLLSLCNQLSQKSKEDHNQRGEEKRAALAGGPCAGKRSRLAPARSATAQLYAVAGPLSRRWSVAGARRRRIYECERSPGAIVGGYLHGRRCQLKNPATQFPAQTRIHPMQFLRKLRLERAHDDLSQPNQGGRP
jgi:hypothetical protein